MHVCGLSDSAKDANKRKVLVLAFQKPKSDTCGQAQNVVIFLKGSKLCSQL